MKLTLCPLSDVAGHAAEAESRNIRDLRAVAGRAWLNESWAGGGFCLRIFTRSHLINRKGIAFAQDRRPPERLSGIYEIASSHLGGYEMAEHGTADHHRIGVANFDSDRITSSAAE